ncbi:hypothetical protein EV663_10261 [Rhodovulum bhavnagarense]|uniref:TIGR02300 family protein n=1 Tax=Rhodovulum bhavnagarense TaxID=992286 RepID=A0A4R2RJ86_9RHOB|nr:FYDLN acid domain-containing protein [Rhodovulum bhavnagarense]TCP62217.1 hypothetical protein EV663_10261 [Rhodovulum bhavnagarense]
MPKEEWGVKRVCPHCSTRFYDLQRDPMTCPSCGQSFSADSLLPGKGRQMITEKATVAKAAPAVLDNDDDVIDDDDGNDVDLDDDILDDDDDDNVSLDDIADVSSDDDEN